MMIDYGWACVLVALAYFCGSIPTGFLFARARGLDIREHGSGNIGATNVARNLGRRLGALVLVLDALEGAAPILLARFLSYDELVDPFVVTACGVAAISGQCFPVWLNFRGGKGVATTLGVILAADPALAGMVVLVFAVVFGAARIVSLSSLCAALSLPVIGWWTGSGDHVVTLAIAASLIIVGKHHSNIRRLWTGHEHQWNTSHSDSQ